MPAPVAPTVAAASRRTKRRKTLPPAIPALSMLPRIRDAGMRSARAPVADAAPGAPVELKSTNSPPAKLKSTYIFS
eukprot:CAMPEP_0194268670 /NCGR_PEP_ID=MMETSP0169-20130528/2948_1 /TAXON_ID=218684 /ORGANISM="Corethron pennatum, Strain L29A3" /LENGTH=75 /DNA_ID=CAMNT_0039009981 /DNA_START=277 /DNA_END=504 /DNA_ORIENTATION=+